MKKVVDSWYFIIITTDSKASAIAGRVSEKCSQGYRGHALRPNRAELAMPVPHLSLQS